MCRELGGRTRFELRASIVLALALAAVISAVAAAPSDAAYPAAANGRIVFAQATFPPGGQDIWIMNADGSGQRNLTNTPAPLDETDPAISPDGRLIAFTRCNRDPSVGDCEIAVMSASGVGVTPLTNHLGGESRDPAFSPDGRRIAFAQEDNSNFSDLIVMSADGSNQVNLTNTSPPLDESSPTFSPDGRNLFFTRRDGDAPRSIWMMDADGSTPVAVTGFGFRADSPAIAPDSREVAYLRCELTGGCVLGFTPIGTTRAVTIDPTPQLEASPVYSPDGKSVAFWAVTDMSTASGAAIYTMSTAGTEVTPLTSISSSVESTEPDWESVYRCGGRRATIVGDDGPEAIKGTKRADVIVANGGNDRIFARAGNDRICGGKGRDKHVGGGGRDLCSGGKGRDGGKGCERGKL